jgi:hypothetical protein
MIDASSDNPSEVVRLLRRAAAGDPEGWRALFERDREILALRHFEQMSNDEAAQAQGLS